MIKTILAGITALAYAILLRIALDWWAWFYLEKRIDILELELMYFIEDNL